MSEEAPANPVESKDEGEKVEVQKSEEGGKEEAKKEEGAKNEEAKKDEEKKEEEKKDTRDPAKVNPLDDDNIGTMKDDDALLIAAKGEDHKVVKEHLESMDPHQRTLKINQFDKLGRTLLFHPVEKGNLKMIEILLDYDADPNIQDNQLNTPLHVAVEREQKQVMLLLVENGADINLANWNKKKTFENDKLDPRTAVEFEKILTNARQAYLAKATTKAIALITDEEKSKYKTMFDAMDEDLDGCLTPFEMHRLFHLVPYPEDYKEVGITKVTMNDMKNFNEMMNISNGLNGVGWRDFLTHVHTFKQNEASGGKKKKGKKKKKK